jgi:hypothetical protein
MESSVYQRKAITTPELNPSALASAGLRTFFNIAEKWQLTAEEQRILLGSPSRSTFFAWKKKPPHVLPADTLERISYIFGIYKAIHILLPVPANADAWIKKPNSAPMFNGKSALHYMLQGRVMDLYSVRQYLDAERGC